LLLGVQEAVLQEADRFRLLLQQMHGILLLLLLLL
jgi:hypothetical protein